MFQIGDLLLFLAGGLTCILRGDLFVSWSGCREKAKPAYLFDIGQNHFPLDRTVIHSHDEVQSNC